MISKINLIHNIDVLELRYGGKMWPASMHSQQRLNKSQLRRGQYEKGYFVRLWHAILNKR